jgi:hypothetical protein
MNQIPLTIIGTLLVIIGGIISITFWIPGIIDRKKLNDVLGPRYPLIFVVYGANGPALFLLGLFLLFWF